MFHKTSPETNEFIRRFLLHVLPKGFFKVRYYGIFANARRKKKCKEKNIKKTGNGYSFNPLPGFLGSTGS